VQNTITDDSRLLTRAQAAEMLGLKAQTLAIWSMTGRNLPVVRIGPKTVRYRRSDILAFIEKQVVPAS